MSHAPALSVLLVTPDCYETLRETVQHLRRQTAKDKLEILIVAPSAADLALVESELDDFASYQIIEVGAIESSSAAKAEGVRRAAAPVVALAEDHCFPDPEWAEALIRAHRGPWAAVGPVVRNANPVNAISWADLLIGYGPWLAPAEGGPVDFLPGHNSSYKRALLLEYGADLETMLDTETLLHWDLRRRGHQLYLEPAATAAHLNFARPAAWIRAQFHNGRLFGANRAQDWPVARRLLYTGAAPLIPAVRLWRILKQHRARAGHTNYRLRHVGPALLAGLAIDAAGQMVGYAAGSGQAMRHLVHLEFHRRRHAGL